MNAPTPDQEALAGRLHHLIIKGLLDEGAAPSTEALAACLGLTPHELELGLRSLSDIHGVVLHPDRCEPWVIHPFSLSPTATWVEKAGRGWWAPCLWCAFGVAALAGGDVTVHSRLGGEGEAVDIPLLDGAPLRDDLVVHFAIPPRTAWANVHHHCAMVLPFQDEAEIDAWSERHRLPRGRAVALEQLGRFARVWYGRHAEPEWRKWSAAQAQEIIFGAGLTGAFWTLASVSGKF